MREKLARRLQSSGLPEDALRDCARVTLTGRTSLLIEGQHGVIELTQEKIRLRTADGVLSVCGGALCLHALSTERAQITGERIDAVAYV